MHQLLLLRHAKASRDDPRLPDRDRPLTGKGRHQAETMRHMMHTLGLAPDLVLVSPSRRTLQTIECLEPWDDTPLTEQIEPLYEADASEIIDILREVSETVRTVLLVGHNPGLRDVVHTLGKSSIDSFPTCALAEFMVTGQWHDLPVGARLTRNVAPDRKEA